MGKAPSVQNSYPPGNAQTVKYRLGWAAHSGRRMARRSCSGCDGRLSRALTLGLLRSGCSVDGPKIQAKSPPLPRQATQDPITQPQWWQPKLRSSGSGVLKHTDIKAGLAEQRARGLAAAASASGLGAMALRLVWRKLGSGARVRAWRGSHRIAPPLHEAF